MTNAQLGLGNLVWRTEPKILNSSLVRGPVTGVPTTDMGLPPSILPEHPMDPLPPEDAPKFSGTSKWLGLGALAIVAYVIYKNV